MRSYIVVVSPSYGGAEKRFFDIFTALRRAGDDVVLVAPSSLTDRLRADHPDRADVLVAVQGIPMPAWSRLRFMLAWFRILRGHPRGGRYHYPLNCLWMLHLGRGDRVSMSVADCTSVPGPFSGKRTSVWAWVAFQFADRIDVLSPGIRMALEGTRRSARMSLTPGGTFVIPPPAPRLAKSPVVVFLGRLVPGKGLDDLLDALPVTWELMRGEAPDGLEFQIAGYGDLERHARSRIEQLASKAVPVRFVGYAEADVLLAPAAVALSMQETTNFPSRVVAESLMAGCGVVVRNTGDSALFGTLPGLVYCNPELRPSELAQLLTGLLRAAVNDPAFRHQVREAAIQRFSSPAYIAYFRDILSSPPAVVNSNDISRPARR